MEAKLPNGDCHDLWFPFLHGMDKIVRTKPRHQRDTRLRKPPSFSAAREGEFFLKAIRNNLIYFIK
ncbi:MAG: hypothetical protein B6245_02345 [Desulfobacteraceae bacterium 4572_88]|nr:MAG: hypothetical protein B6245_02345 [Desulfobacteraceae bacterium 4572_88]